MRKEEERQSGFIATVAVGILAIIVLIIAPSIVSVENMDMNYSKDFVYQFEHNGSRK